MLCAIPYESHHSILLLPKPASQHSDPPAEGSNEMNVQTMKMGNNYHCMVRLERLTTITKALWMVRVL